MSILHRSARQHQETCQSMSGVIRRSGRPLADVRGLVQDLDRNGFTKDQIHKHLVRATALARLAKSFA